MKRGIMMKEPVQMKKLINTLTIVVLLLIGALIIMGYANGIFRSQEIFKSFILDCGLAGCLIFTLYQAIQVVFPVLPGAIGCVAGVMAFGPVYGFLYNYIGICIGSAAAFFLAKRYGSGFVRKITSPGQYEKYGSWLNKGKRFEIFFIAAIVLPIAPDDFLCFLAGLTKMGYKKFMLIILLGKPVTLAAYSLAFTYGLDYLLNLL